ncbi:hypothetical protein J2S02_003354 [Metabacillus niabensis]|uniref:Uncharacterized protein n=1 Tax=Metabacillus niabensis TaxID=324854 RepID=A0ABT9Z427_9BACI|nr:hypothetical protein [Metabacillus niabensis]
MAVTHSSITIEMQLKLNENLANKANIELCQSNLKKSELIRNSKFQIIVRIFSSLIKFRNQTS